MVEVNLRKLPKVYECVSPRPTKAKTFIVANRFGEGEIVVHPSGLAYLDVLWVDERYRGEGRGTRTLVALERRAKKEGATHIQLQVGSFFGRKRPEHRLTRWYKQRGYTPVKGHNGWLVTKTL